MEKSDPKNLKADTSYASIDILRNSIDEIDEKIVSLFNKRLMVAKEIGELKELNNDQVQDIERENSLLKGLEKLNKGPLKNSTLNHIYKEIIAASREIQSPQLVAYLGPEATFTNIAAIKHFGHSVTFVPQPSIRDVFLEVEKGVVNYGVVPVENSIEGAVNHTLDLFFESDLKICAEIFYTISHDLLATTGSLEDIKVIYSHPHAFAQCRRWLRRHLPSAELSECSSTAHAARKASKESGSAAIAGTEAAHLYNLQIVSSGIEDFSRNITRFLVIGHDEAKMTGNDKTSVMFVTTHVPGALYKVLKPVADAEINMAKLESRPTKYENWSYFLFADLEGHIEDSKMRRAIDEMKSLTLYLKILGSYPKAQNID